jgi:tetratricopeptide (TPR) repeat protein
MSKIKKLCNGCSKLCNGCSNTLKFINSNWIVLSAIVLSVCCLRYNFSPLTYIQQQQEINIIHLQQEHLKLQRELQEESLKQSFIDFHNELGIRLLFAEQINAAKNEFNQVLKVDSLNQNAARCLFECNVFSEVKNQSYNPEVIKMQLEQLSKQNINDPLPYLYLGDFALATYQNKTLALNQNNISQLNDAEYFYKKVISLNNSTAAAYAGLGVIYNKQNKPNLALQSFKQAVNLSPWNVIYRDNLAYTYYILKDYKNTISWCATIVSLAPLFLDPYTSYSNSYRCLGELINASKVQEKQIKLMETDSTKDLLNTKRTFFYYDNSGNNVPLYDYDLKKYYFYHNIALTDYLIGNKDKTTYYVNKAEALNIDPDSKSKVKGILMFDIENLQKAQPTLINKTIEFKNNYGIK